MNRRAFLQRAALIASGVVAADQLDLLDRLGWKRRFFPSVGLAPTDDCGGYQHMTDLSGRGMSVTQEQWTALLRDVYSAPVLLARNALNTPFHPRSTTWSFE